MSGEVPHDGFCPRCKALADEACHVGRRAVPDHMVRHPMPTPAVPVGVQPEPAEERKRMVPVDEYPDVELLDKRPVKGHVLQRPEPAVPVVHPEPGDGYTYVSTECDDHDDARCPRPDECACHCHEDRAAKWRAGLDEAVIPVRVRKAMALADAEVAAAVAAVRADTWQKGHDAGYMDRVREDAARANCAGSGSELGLDNIYPAEDPS